MVESTLVEPQPERESVMVASAHHEPWDALLQEHFGSEWERARAVMQCESGGRESALGDTHLTYWQDGQEWGSSAGLFQIRNLPGRPEQSWLMKGENNIRYAAQMWRAQGWTPWTCKYVLGL